MHTWGDKYDEALKLWNSLRQWRETVHRVLSEQHETQLEKDQLMYSYQADLLILQCGGVPPKGE